jgi:hypothetical protein
MILPKNKTRLQKILAFQNYGKSLVNKRITMIKIPRTTSYQILHLTQTKARVKLLEIHQEQSILFREYLGDDKFYFKLINII